MTDTTDDDYEWPECGPQCPQCPHPVAWHDNGGCTLDAVCPCMITRPRTHDGVRADKAIHPRGKQ